MKRRPEKKINKKNGNISLIEENIEKIASYYNGLGAENFIQIDSFL